MANNNNSHSFPHRSLRGPKGLLFGVIIGGLESEYKANYRFRTDMDTYAYLNQNGVLFGDSLSGASAWQNLCPPGMYCTEQCHIGTGWPIRMVVDTGLSEKEPTPRGPCCVRVTG
ncbi:hypothetical protein NQ318_013281 [Aromia moschata]|uniref:Uncharacterized protein n=1 Tax=Aromia moschata TaxID=1265417 RepID=A0AAV8XUK7_9CUCU|nr:hypothetical protein NQ318_013281 [Aromia moschata]